MKLNNNTYDVLKFIAQIVLPAAGTLYFALTKIWGLPYGTEIVGLSILCSDLIQELAMYRETDREEEAMQKILSIEDNAEK